MSEFANELLAILSVGRARSLVRRTQNHKFQLNPERDCFAFQFQRLATDVAEQRANKATSQSIRLQAENQLKQLATVVR